MQERLIAIGDIHGRDVWKKIVEQEVGATKEVFIGDYWDSFDIPFEEQKQNFLDLIKYKQENPQRVVLLIGNHDFHYIRSMDEQYSGYQSKHAPTIEALVCGAIARGDMQMAYSNQDYLFTHAGVTREWCLKYGIHAVPSEINKLFGDRPKAFKFYPGDISLSGSDRNQSPIWVRPDSLLPDMATTKQIVGHTHQKGITYCDKGELILIDALEGGNFLIIKDRKPETGYVEA